MASAFERGLFGSVRPRAYAELLAAGISPSALRGPTWCCDPGSNHPGVRQARQAIEFADARSAIPGESRLRMFYVTEAHLPRPEVNVGDLRLRRIPAGHR